MERQTNKSWLAVNTVTVYGETGKVSQKAVSQNLGQGNQNSYKNKSDAWISFKPTIPEAPDLYALFYVCMHDYAILYTQLQPHLDPPTANHPGSTTEPSSGTKLNS